MTKQFTDGERVIAMMLAEWAHKASETFSLGLDACEFSPCLIDTALSLGEDDLIMAHVNRHDRLPENARAQKYEAVYSIMEGLRFAPDRSIPPFGGFSDDAEASAMVSIWRSTIASSESENISFNRLSGDARPFDWWKALSAITILFGSHDADDVYPALRTFLDTGEVVDCELP